MLHKPPVISSPLKRPCPRSMARCQRFTDRSTPIPAEVIGLGHFSSDLTQPLSGSAIKNETLVLMDAPTFSARIATGWSLSIQNNLVFGREWVRATIEKRGCL